MSPTFVKGKEKTVVLNEGTPGFAAPEQFGGVIHRTTDIYGFGRTLLFILLPWTVALKFLYNDPEELKLYDTKLGEVFRFLTNPDPSKRPQSFEVFEKTIKENFEMIQRELIRNFDYFNLDDIDDTRFIGTNQSFYLNHAVHLKKSKEDRSQASSELCVPLAVTDSFQKSLAKVAGFNVDFWRDLQVFITCVSPRTNEGIAEGDISTDVLEAFSQR